MTPNVLFFPLLTHSLFVVLIKAAKQVTWDPTYEACLSWEVNEKTDPHMS